MSANNEVIIRRKQNGLYEIRECQTEDGTIEENTISLISFDVDGLDVAIDIANNYLDRCDDEGYSVEYGMRIL